MKFISCSIFKTDYTFFGKEKVYIREDTTNKTLLSQIYDNREYENMIYAGFYLNSNKIFLLKEV